MSRPKFLTGFVVALVLVGSGAVKLRRLNHEFQITRSGMIIAAARSNSLQGFLSSAETAESAQRKYLLTGNPASLESFNRAISEIDVRIKHALELYTGEQACPAALAHLGELVKGEIEERRAEIQSRTRDGTETPRAAIPANPGEAKMEEIRSLVIELQQSESQSLERGRERYELGLAQRDEFSAAVIVGGLALLGLVFVAMHRNATYRARAAFELLQASLRLTAILKTMGEGLYQVDHKGNLVYLNPAGENLLGYSEEEILGKSMHELIHLRPGSDQPCLDQGCPLVLLLTDGASHRGSNDRFRRKDGSIITVDYTCSTLIRYGERQGAVLVFRDTTERNRMETALRKSEERYRNLITKSRGFICTHDMEGILLSVNEASAESLGYDSAELEGKNLRELLAPASADKFDWYLKAISEWGSHSGFMRVVTKDGNEIVWSYSNRVIQDSDTPAYVLGNAQDVTAQILTEEALKASEEKLHAALEAEKNASRTDFLTGIPNRRTFYEAVEAEVKRARRYPRPITLVYIDVDNFKFVNDTLGHATGDTVLKCVADTVRSTIRCTDMVARLGGDEFALLLPETNSKEAGIVIGKLQPCLQQAVNRHDWPIGFSIGIVTFTTPLDSVDQMIKRADDLMYEVKRNGKSATACETV